MTTCEGCQFYRSKKIDNEIVAMCSIQIDIEPKMITWCPLDAASRKLTELCITE